MRYLKKGEIIRSGDFYKALGGKNKSTFHLVCVEKGYSGAIGSRVGDLLTTVHRPSKKKVVTHSTSDNTAMFQFLFKIKTVLDSGSEYLIVPNFTIHKKLNAVLAQQKHS